LTDVKEMNFTLSELSTVTGQVSGVAS
jgi:hypothetical protein